MTLQREILPFLLIAGLLAACCLLPAEPLAPAGPAAQSLLLVRDYARHQIPQAFLPSVLLAGALAAFVRRDAVVRALGPGAPRPLAYAAAGLGGAALSVCSCGALPLFAGLRRAGAALGPSCTFLYAAPALNLLALVLTARVIGTPMTLARTAAAFVLSVLLGLAMAALFGREPARHAPAATPAATPTGLARPLALLAAFLAALVFLNLSPTGYTGLVRCCDTGSAVSSFSALSVQRNGDTVTITRSSGDTVTVPASRLADLQPAQPSRLAAALYHHRFLLAALAAACAAVMLAAWFPRDQVLHWLACSWALAKTILPFLLAGVAVSGLLLGRLGSPGLIPPRAIASALHGSGLLPNLLGALTGAMVCFSTLLEVPFVQGLMASGMSKGPALAMLLSGPAASLPTLLVLAGLLGPRKTAAFLLLVLLASTLAGLLFSAL